MYHNLKLVTAVAGLALAACASTDGAPTEAGLVAPAAMAGSDFVPLDDGGVWHPASEGRCPAELAGFAYTEPVVFKPDGSDVGCQYRTESDHLTVYFYQSDRLKTASDAAEEAAGAIVYRFQNAQYLKDDSESCTIKIDLIGGVSAMLQQGPEDGGVIEIGKTPCLIFRIPEGLTLVATDMVGPWHLKVRLTSLTPDANTEDVISRTSEIMNLENSWMSGEPILNFESLMREQSSSGDTSPEDEGN